MLDLLLMWLGRYAVEVNAYEEWPPFRFVLWGRCCEWDSQPEQFILFKLPLWHWELVDFGHRYGWTRTYIGWRSTNGWRSWHAK